MIFLFAVAALTLQAQTCPSDGGGTGCGSCSSETISGSPVITRTGTTVVVPPGLGLFINTVIEEEGSTEIKVSYSIVDNSEVALGLYDMEGRLIRLIADGFHEMGNHLVWFDAQDLEPGMYLLRLDALGGYAWNRIYLLR